ncbi:MAG: DUF308 domain-containing protein [Ignavibacteria bacterium]|nr:DUF308 domain-containing protein [Ignavibacteria bacterium]
MLKKWWVILIQGILMFILGIFVFNNPAEVLAGVSLWFGILILLTGVMGIFSWIFGGKDMRESVSLLWSIVSVFFGLFVLMNILATMKAVTIIFGIWVLFTGFSLLTSGWSLKKDSFIGWLLVVVGIFSIAAGFMMIFNISTGAEGVAVLLGLQIILTGIALIIFSFAKKAIAGKIEDKINSLKKL